MSSSRRRIGAAVAALALAAALTPMGQLAQAQSSAYPNVGRPATAREIRAWDIDVRPDFKGLPPGTGTVARGMEVWESKCASCHGIFGESNEVFSPIVGGTTKDDIRTGRVARLTDASYPGRTTLMKLSSVSTLWDYINRAMPWTQPKSLSTEEVYGVTAYILAMGGIVPDDFALSDRNVAEVQKLLPNRNGMTTDHGLWPGAGFGKAKPDVRVAACMKDCAGEVSLASTLPDFARDAHGNLSQQNRAVGAQVGADTSRPAPPAAAGPPAARPVAAAAPRPPAAALAGAAVSAMVLTQKHGCIACHGIESKVVGPGFREIARKYAGRGDAPAHLAARIKAGGSGVWGAIPMPPQALAEGDARVIAQWLADGMKQ